jgi:hypothetical protein
MSEHLHWYKKIAADGTCLSYTQAANEEAGTSSGEHATGRREQWQIA